MPAAVVGVVASIIGKGAIATIIGNAIVGAAIGAAVSAVTGGDIGKGAMYGAIGGAVMGAISGPVGGQMAVGGELGGLEGQVLTAQGGAGAGVGVGVAPAAQTGMTVGQQMVAQGAIEAVKVGAAPDPYEEQDKLEREIFESGPPRITTPVGRVSAREEFDKDMEQLTGTVRRPSVAVTPVTAPTVAAPTVAAPGDLLRKGALA